ncbi:MAG: hydroxymethylglutaryl-CoA lyase [Candidatus Promineifilaceae bacterium]
MQDFLRICEVGLRDGLQNEPVTIATEDKLAVLDSMIAAGLTYIEAASYVRPSAVPQMADSDAVMQAAATRYAKHPTAHFTGLVFNNRGYDRAIASGCRAIAVALSVSDTFSQRNNRMTRRKSVEVFKQLMERARADGVWVRVYLSTAWVCPFEGYTPQGRTISFAEMIWEEGIDELAIADTIGHAGPLEVGRLFQELGRRLDMNRLAAHLHDTQVMGLTNAAAAIHAGVRVIDSSLAGLGGCPFAPGAAGNLATEDLAFLAFKMGIGTGVDFPKLMAAADQVRALVGREACGRIRPWWDSHHVLV